MVYAVRAATTAQPRSHMQMPMPRIMVRSAGAGSPGAAGQHRSGSTVVVTLAPSAAVEGAAPAHASTDAHAGSALLGAASWSKIRQVRRNLERCGESTPAARCANHHACATERDAALAAEIGAARAVFVRRQVDVREPWPPYSGRADRFPPGGRTRA